MIVGIGTDIVAIARVEKAYARYGDKLTRRVLTDDERAQCQPDEVIRFLAKRFAAKEALSKALGIGIISPMGWQAVSVLRGPLGQPVCVCHSPALQQWLDEREVKHIHLSVTDERAYAVAFVIVATA